MKRAAALLVVITAATAAARADNVKADERFKAGKRLLAQKHYAEACKAFEDSNRLDPGIGAELNVGHCYEEWGKLATAYRAYKAAEGMAKTARDPRLPKIRGLVEALDAQVPRLTIEVAKDARVDGLVVTLDGDPFARADLGAEQRIDPGPHKLEYRTSETARRSKMIPIERGGSSDITLDLPRGDAEPEATVTAAPPDRHGGEAEAPAAEKKVYAVAPGHRRHIEGAVTMGVGVLGMVGAGVLTLTARSSYRSALAADCGGDTASCDAVGLQKTHDARSQANLASVVFGIGAAVAVTGLVIYVTAPHGRAIREHSDEAMRTRTRIVPLASPDGAGLVVLGAF